MARLREPPEAPPPQPGTWGDHPCGMRDPLTEADAEQRHGSGPEAVIRQLELGSPGSIASAAGEPWAGVAWHEILSFYRSASLAKNPPPPSILKATT